MRRSGQWRKLAAGWGSAMCLGLLGCGYHQVGSTVSAGGGVRTVAVPIFASRVQGFAIETIFTQAVVRELNTRTRLRVLTAVNGGERRAAGAGATGADAQGVDPTGADATLQGTILSETVAPLTYDASSGQTSSYLVSVGAKVVLVAADGRVLYENDAFSWRQQYQSTQDLSGSIQEDSMAVRRMATDFAQALVSGMMSGLR